MSTGPPLLLSPLDELHAATPRASARAAATSATGATRRRPCSPRREGRPAGVLKLELIKAFLPFSISLVEKRTRVADPPPDASPATRGRSRAPGSGHAVRRLPAVQDCEDVLGDQRGHRVPRPGGGGSDVRQQHASRRVQQYLGDLRLALVDVQTGGADPLVPKGAGESIGIDERPARRV